ncbi:hypothetical protein NQZ68_016078 [Dissostichus eleginoides]|nr:hypothetical protein NQZ68_016078 [Dissostichus eleginoides]
MTATAHLLLDGAKETAETETDKRTEGEGRREGGMIKRIAAIMMRHLTGRTLSPSRMSMGSLNNPAQAVGGREAGPSGASSPYRATLKPRRWAGEAPRAPATPLSRGDETGT